MNDVTKAIGDDESTFMPIVDHAISRVEFHEECFEEVAERVHVDRENAACIEIHIVDAAA